MTLESYLPRLIGYAKFLSKDNYEDLVQDTVVRLLANKHKYTLSEEILNTICRNLWIDGIKSSKEYLSDNFNELCDIVLVAVPDVEEHIYSKEVGIDLYDWPKNYSSKRSIERIKKNKKRKISKESKAKFAAYLKEYKKKWNPANRERQVQLRREKRHIQYEKRDVLQCSLQLS